MQQSFDFDCECDVFTFLTRICMTQLEFFLDWVWPDLKFWINSKKHKNIGLCRRQFIFYSTKILCFFVLNWNFVKLKNFRPKIVKSLAISDQYKWQQIFAFWFLAFLLRNECKSYSNMLNFLPLSCMTLEWLNLNDIQTGTW